MHDKLKEIVSVKKEEVRALRHNRGEFNGRNDAARPFTKAIRAENRLAVIAEVKKASPSKGVIRPDFDPAAIAAAYEKGGAAAISVLTDERFFKGSNNNLCLVRNQVALPVLRKEFIIDPLQVEETAHLNSDAMLLIAAILSNDQMAELYAAALDLNVEPLIEVHTMAEVERAFRLSPKLLGINNRNLDTFATDIETTFLLVKNIPDDVTVVSESGIENGKQARRLLSAGVHALLVGESLVKLKDPSNLIRELSGKVDDPDA